MIPPVYFCGFLGLSIVLNFMWPVALIFHAPYSYAGALLIVFGFVLMSWARRLFKREGMPVRPGEELTNLAVSGPYRFTRNPMYAGLTLILMGGSMGLGSLAAFLGPIGFWTVIHCFFIPFEEKKLEDAFGEKYLEYKRKVRRWF
ncbi:MAG: isoprenylcysteine carboxylmethyltransferase family protein [Candidatus Omnitrophota bacterium]|jgi:protein-S-isoprenylcysteine O-methyltransferase Ste14